MSEKTISERKDMDAAYMWRLEDIFPDDAHWEESFKWVEQEMQKLEGYRMRLGESAQTLYDFLTFSDALEERMSAVYVYANMKSHQDMRDMEYQEMSSRASSLQVSYMSASAFVSPELLDIPEETIRQFMEEKKELRQYERFFQELFRRKPHILSREMEELLADAGEVLEIPENTFAMFNNADIRFPSIEDEDGNMVQITHGNFIRYMKSGSRSVRKAAFDSVYHTYQAWENTLASNYAANVKQAAFVTRARKFDGSLERYLYGNEIPVEVYRNLIDVVHRYLPAMHRYMALRKKAMGLSELHMYDLYVPMVEQVKMEIPYEQAKYIVSQALKPLGKEYGEILESGFTDGWIDVYENKGKRSGAYSWGTYGTHPYVLLNQQDDLDSVFTIAHEMGHAIHSYYSNKNQPLVYAGYRIFVAEVASTCNEKLLMDYLMKNSRDEDEKKYFLGHHLEGFRTTLFRQTMFAEFERLTHEKAAAGEVLTAQRLKEIYHELNVLYFGPDVVVDGEIDMEWARIPHFYTPFYVYQYATGYAAATAFSKKILEEGSPAVEKYINNFLKKGSSKAPIDLLRDAGVDMAGVEPVEQALDVFTELVDKLEDAMR